MPDSVRKCRKGHITPLDCLPGWGWPVFAVQAMPSLRTLLAQHGPVLLLDAASTLIQVGWLEGDCQDWRWASAEAEAGVGLFDCVARLGRNPNEARAFVYCEGPGSILGIRTAAAAIRAWNVVTPRPCWAYRSLDLLVHSLPEGARVIADARRDTWHLAERGREMRRAPSSELAGLAGLHTPGSFRAWTKLPAAVSPAIIPYSLSSLLPGLLDSDLLLPAPEPDAFLHEDPSYATWTPQIHRAPVQSTARPPAS